jgi:putative DNA primase/helicase
MSIKPKDIDEAVKSGLITSADQLRQGVATFIPVGTLPPTFDLSSCLISASDLSNLEIPRRARLLDKWLCEGDLGYIFAPRGVGKTWLAMALPAAISQGKELGLWQSGEFPTRVLYIDGEMPLELTKLRSRGLGLGSGDVTYLHHETIFENLDTSLNLGDATHRDAITKLLLDNGFRCVILDNLSSLASGVVENKGEDYEPIGPWLLELRPRKITVIVIHHAGRNGLMRGC